MVDAESSKQRLIKPDRQRLELLRRTLEEALTPLFAEQRICYVDLPIHLNIGDMLIEKGTCTFFDGVGARVLDRIALLDQERLFRQGLPEDMVIVFHGGGNFGDLYPHHQDLRLRVVEAFPRNRIVMLPQTVYFKHPEAFARQAEVFSRHPDFHLFARDNQSKTFLSEHLPSEQVGLLPDMATMLYGLLPQSGDQSEDVLLFRRRDIEAGGKEDPDAFDWRNLISKQDRRRYRDVKRRLKLQNKTGVNFGGHARWISFREAMISKAVQHYQSFGIVDTDRLHGFILAQLLDKPAIARDNSYGKLAGYINTWL